MSKEVKIDSSLVVPSENPTDSVLISLVFASVEIQICQIFQPPSAAKNPGFRETSKVVAL